MNHSTFHYQRNLFYSFISFSFLSFLSLIFCLFICLLMASLMDSTFRDHLFGQIYTFVFKNNLVLRKVYTTVYFVVDIWQCRPIWSSVQSQSPCHPICKTSGMFVPIWSPVSSNGKDKGMTTEVFTGRAISTLLLQNHLPSLFPVFYEDIRKEMVGMDNFKNRNSWVIKRG